MCITYIGYDYRILGAFLIFCITIRYKINIYKRIVYRITIINFNIHIQHTINPSFEQRTFV